MNRIKKSRILVSIAMFSLALGNIVGWTMRLRAVPFWVDMGDFVIGLGVGLSFTLSLFAFRMKMKSGPAC